MKRAHFCQVSELRGLRSTRAGSGSGVRTSWKGQQDVVLDGREPLDHTGGALALPLFLKGEGCVPRPLQPEGTPAWVSLSACQEITLPSSRQLVAWVPANRVGSPRLLLAFSVSSSFSQNGTTSAKPVERARTRLTHPLTGRGRNVVHIFHFLGELLSYVEGTDVLEEGNSAQI